MRNVESIEVGYGEALQFGVSQGTYYKEPEQLLTEAYEVGKREQADELEAGSLINRRIEMSQQYETLSKEVIDVISQQLCISKETIEVASNMQDLDVDSLDIYELSIALEEAFNVTFDTDEITEYTDIASIINLILKKMKDER